MNKKNLTIGEEISRRKKTSTYELCETNEIIKTNDKSKTNLIFIDHTQNTKEEQNKHSITMKKIYIIGPVGSGKTTFSKKLSQKYNIKRYELDKVSWDDENGNIKRIDEEAKKLFDEILKNETWIIEDVGRNKFKKGRKQADVIFYIKLSRLKSYFRVTKRWIKQKLGKEEYNCPPTFKQLLYFFSTVNSYYKKEKTKLKELEKYKNKVIFVNDKKINNILQNK